jgi:hypothetical protein
VEERRLQRRVTGHDKLNRALAPDGPHGKPRGIPRLRRDGEERERWGLVTGAKARIFYYARDAALKGRSSTSFRTPRSCSALCLSEKP